MSSLDKFVNGERSETYTSGSFRPASPLARSKNSKERTAAASPVPARTTGGSQQQNQPHQQSRRPNNLPNIKTSTDQAGNHPPPASFDSLVTPLFSQLVTPLVAAHHATTAAVATTGFSASPQLSASAASAPPPVTAAVPQNVANQIANTIKSASSPQSLVLAIIAAIMICFGISWIANMAWIIVEPYSVALVGAMILSVALHEPVSDLKADDRNRWPISKAIAEARIEFRKNWPKLRLLAPLVAIPLYYHFALQSAAARAGLDKYPVFNSMPEVAQNFTSLSALLLVVARLSRFLFPDITIGLLFGSIAMVAVPTAVSFLIVWFVDDRQFVRTMRLLLSVLGTTLVGGCFVVSIVAELQQSGQSSVRAIQRLGFEVPDNAAEMASSYVLSKNTTERLLPALKEFQFNGTWSEIFNNAKEFVMNHTSTLSLALSETQPVAGSVGSVLSNMLKFVGSSLSWGLGKLYEVTLFLMTLTTLLSLERTILYYFLKKVLGIVFADASKAHQMAERTEKRMINELSTLFYSLWHVFVFHFLSTLVWYSAFDMPLSVCVSTVGGMLALFPLSLPPMLTQLIIAVLVQAIRREFSVPMLLTGVFFYATSLYVDLIVVSEEELPRYNKKRRAGSASGTGASGSCDSSVSSPALPLGSSTASLDGSASTSASPLLVQPSQRGNTPEKKAAETKASAFLVTTSIILGLTAYGPVGVVIGPLVFITAHAVWDAF